MRGCDCRTRLSATLFAICAVPAAAMPLPRDGAEFVQRFRAAVAAPGSDALADATRLPFLFEGRPHGRADFVRRVVPQLFTPALRGCVQHARPQVESTDAFTLWCAPYGLHFGRDAAGRWQLIELSADGEEAAR